MIVLLELKTSSLDLNDVFILSSRDSVRKQKEREKPKKDLKKKKKREKPIKNYVKKRKKKKDTLKLYI